MARTDNGRYADGGRGLVAAYDSGWDADLWDASRRKNGAPFPCADGLIMAAAALRTAMRIPYRQLSGIPGSMMDDHGSPSYPTVPQDAAAGRGRARRPGLGPHQPRGVRARLLDP